MKPRSIQGVGHGEDDAHGLALISQLPWSLRTWIYIKGAARMVPAEWFFPVSVAAALSAALHLQAARIGFVHGHWWAVWAAAVPLLAISGFIKGAVCEASKDARAGRRILAVLMGVGLGCSLLRMDIASLPFQPEEVRVAWAKDAMIVVNPANPAGKAAVYWETGPTAHMFKRHCGWECVPDALSDSNLIEAQAPTWAVVQDAAMFRNGLWLDLLNAGVVALFCLADAASGFALGIFMPLLRKLGRWSPKASWRAFQARIEASVMADPKARADLERKALGAVASKGASAGRGRSRL